MTSPFERRQAWDQERNLTKVQEERTRLANALYQLVTASQAAHAENVPGELLAAEQDAIQALDALEATSWSRLQR